MAEPKDTSGLTEASQEAVKYTLRLEAERDRLRVAAKGVLSECFVPATGPTWRWHQEYYDAFDKLREALNEQPERKGG